MTVTGAKETSNWQVLAGSLPPGLSIDPVTGIIAGTVSTPPGEFVFELGAEADGKHYSRWFSIRVIAAGTSSPSTAPGSGSSSGDQSGAGSNPGDSSGGNSSPGPGSSGASNPGPGDGSSGDPDPGSGSSGSGANGQGSGSGSGSGGQGSGGSSSDPGDGGSSDPSSDPGSDPSAGDPSSDPGQIAPGSGGSTPDAIELEAPATIHVTVGESLDDALTATSSAGLPVTLDVADLPEWLAFDGSDLRGTAPLTEGPTQVEVTATDGRATETRDITINVVPRTPALTPATLALIAGQVGGMTLDADDGATDASFVYRLDQSSPGLALVGQQLTAERDDPGSWSITVGVEDLSSPDPAWQEIVIPVTVQPTPLLMANDSEAATQYAPASVQLTASGGWGSYSFSVVGGSLPSGLRLLSNGQIAGTPSGTGTSTAVVRVTDSHGLTATASVSFTVAANPAVAPTSSISVGTTPQSVALSPDGNTAFVADFGSKEISVINRATGTVVNTVTTTGQPESVVLSPDGSKLLVVNYVGGLQILDAQTLATLATIPASAAVAGAWSADGTTVYFLRSVSASSTELDVANGSSGAVISTKSIGGFGSRPEIHVLDDGRLVANGSSSASVAIIDPITMAVSTIATGLSAATSVAVDGDVLWIATGSSANNLVEVDLTLGKVVGKWSSGVSTQAGSALSPDGRWLYLADASSGTVVVWDTQLGKAIATVPVGKSPRSVTVSADGKQVFVTDSGDSTVTVLSPAQ
ncbi:hypothetical protein GCM10022286_00580 [Gryllotalpicola daejeonensis]|uniref:Dystroglycan-type cadherin-like domain-containing protein n=2 Tax=Gryllotalpicola daejeonensis TaxID=993087 RepID=A0ABP7ZD62_9MICO